MFTDGTSLAERNSENIIFEWGEGKETVDIQIPLNKNSDRKLTYDNIALIDSSRHNIVDLDAQSYSLNKDNTGKTYQNDDNSISFNGSLSQYMSLSEITRKRQLLTVTVNAITSGPSGQNYGSVSPVGEVQVWSYDHLSITATPRLSIHRTSYYTVNGGERVYLNSASAITFEVQITQNNTVINVYFTQQGIEI